MRASIKDAPSASDKPSLPNYSLPPGRLVMETYSDPTSEFSSKEVEMKHGRFLIGVVVIAVLALSVSAQDKKPPSAEAIQSAQQTSDLLLATLFAALSQEFAETTPSNVPQGTQSIGLLFNDKNDNMRLVGTLQPLSDNDLPKGTFEEAALARAMQGQNTTNVEKVNGEWVYRRSIALKQLPSIVHDVSQQFRTAEYVAVGGRLDAEGSYSVTSTTRKRALPLIIRS
jgi:hypothetical protein